MSFEFLYLSKGDVDRTGLTMVEIVDVVEQAFGEKGGGRVEVPPKPGVHPKMDAFIHAMPAFIPKMKVAGVKWVSGFPNNYRCNLPYIMGVVVLNDLETGAPLCIMDASWITAKRTGAATAVAAKYLARKDSKVFGILGCGVQGRSNLEAVVTVFKGFACSLDFDSYWKPQAMHSMHKFCTNDVEQLLYYQSVGYFQDIPDVYADLGELVTGKKTGREDDLERTMSMNLGLAIEDMATAVKVYERAKSRGIGTWLKL